MTQWVFQICFSSVLEIKLQQIFVSERNLQFTAKLFQKQGMLQPCRSNNLKNLFFEPSAAISVKIRDFRVFLAKSSLKNICDLLVHWNLSLERFGDQTNTKLCWEAKSAICLEIFQKRARAAGIQSENQVISLKSLLKCPTTGFSIC